MLCGEIVGMIVGMGVGLALGLEPFQIFFFIILPIMAGGVGEGQSRFPSAMPPCCIWIRAWRSAAYCRW